MSMFPLLVLLATTTIAAGYLQPARPPVHTDQRPKLETLGLGLGLEELEQRHEITQPPLTEKTLWERALERQEWDTLQQPQLSPASPQEEARTAIRTPKKQGQRQTKKPSSWEQVTKLAATGGIVEGHIVSVNGGGAICHVHGLRAFIPNSHLGERPAALVGQTLPLKVLRADAATRRLVVSHREAVRDTLRRGDIVHGVVTALRPYGAFVSFGGGLRGLLHKHSISVNDWKLVRHDRGYVVDACFRHAGETPGVLLEVGSAVKCLVTGHNRDNGRISLSTRALEPAPGDMLRDPRGVFAGAEAMAAAHRDQRAQELLEYEILASICEENSLSSLLNDLLP